MTSMGVTYPNQSDAKAAAAKAANYTGQPMYVVRTPTGRYEVTHEFEVGAVKVLPQTKDVSSRPAMDRVRDALSRVGVGALSSRPAMDRVRDALSSVADADPEDGTWGKKEERCTRLAQVARGASRVSYALASRKYREAITLYRQGKYDEARKAESVAERAEMDGDREGNRN